MASIKGLSAQYAEALAGAAIGDLLLIESFPQQAQSEVSETGSEAEDGDEASEGDADSDSEAESSASDGSDEEHSEPEIEDEEDEQNAGHVNEAVEIEYSTKIYAIHNLSKDKEGNIDMITLRELSHCLKPSEATKSSLHVYGEEIVHAQAPSKSQDNTTIQAYNIQDIVTSDEIRGYEVYLYPTGSDLRMMMFHGRCPARCNDGWISSQEEMHMLVTDSIRLLSPYAPVCPVCIGKNEMQEYQSLRELYEDSYQVDIGQLVEFYGRLNPRRRSLGYSFKQFDEREWGMSFDDMLSESEDGQEPDGGWERWDEAYDPNANPAFTPASDAAVAAISLKPFTQMTNAGEEAICVVCNTQFEGKAIVSELPCSHYFHTDCVQPWLRTSNSCPTCRKKLPEVGVEVEVVPPELNGSGSVNGADGESDAVSVDEEAFDGQTGGAKVDDEDLVMEDATAMSAAA